MKKETQFKVGDILKVVNSGDCYSSYSEMFYRMKFVNTDHNDSHDHGTIVQVFNVDYHPSQEVAIYAVRSEDGFEALYGAEGLQKLQFNKRATTVDLNCEVDAIVHEDRIEFAGHVINKYAFKKLVKAARSAGVLTLD
jgi:hypothetical protein